MDTFDLGRNVTYKDLLSQSVLDVVNDDMFKRKCLMEN